MCQALGEDTGPRNDLHPVPSSRTLSGAEEGQVNGATSGHRYAGGGGACSAGTCEVTQHRQGSHGNLRMMSKLCYNEWGGVTQRKCMHE